MNISQNKDDPYYLLKNLEFIDSLTIPYFLESVELSRKRKAIYFQEQSDFIQRTDGKIVNLSVVKKEYNTRAKMLRLKRVHKSKIKSKFRIDIQGFLVDQKGERVLANPRAVGTPKKVSINFQNIYSGKLDHYGRSEVMKAVKNDMLSHVIAAINKGFQLNDFPLYIILKYCNTTDKNGNELWDVGNACILYTKAFLDLIATGSNGDSVGKKKIQYFDPIIPDDSHVYVKSDPWPVFIPVEKTEERKLIFEFFKLKNI